MAHFEWTTEWVIMASKVKRRSSPGTTKMFRIVSGVVLKLFGTSAVLTVWVNAGPRAVVDESQRLLGSCQLVVRA